MSREVCGICWCPYDEETGACGCEPASKEHDMTTLRTAAQQALEALELAQTDVYWELNSPTRKFLRKAEKNLRAALVEPEHKPIPLNEGRLWQYSDGNIGVGTPAEPGCVRADPDVPEVGFGNMEPAGWFEGPFGEFRANQLFKHSWPAQTVAWSIPLYLAPPQRKPLETKQLEQIMADCFANEGLPQNWWDWRIRDFVRAVERAHGIT